MFIFKQVKSPTSWHKKSGAENYLGGGSVVKVWDQDVCFLYGLRVEPCGCLYDSHRRLTWSLTSGPMKLVEVCANWPEYIPTLKKKKISDRRCAISSLESTHSLIYLLLHVAKKKTTPSHTTSHWAYTCMIWSFDEPNLCLESHHQS
jgi:hypothetical protein